MSDEVLEETDLAKKENSENLIKLIVAHYVVGIVTLAIWAATDSWYLLTDLVMAKILSVGAALVAGVVVSTLIHEWFHFIGAISAGASYSIPSKLGLFVFDYDFEKNSLNQFFSMSVGGQIGGLLAVILLFIFLPMDNSGRIMLVSAAIGSAVFAGFIEWPVIMRARISREPQQELKKINQTTLCHRNTCGGR